MCGSSPPSSDGASSQRLNGTGVPLGAHFAYRKYGSPRNKGVIRTIRRIAVQVVPYARCAPSGEHFHRAGDPFDRTRATIGIVGRCIVAFPSSLNTAWRLPFFCNSQYRPRGDEPPFPWLMGCGSPVRPFFGSHGESTRHPGVRTSWMVAPDGIERKRRIFSVTSQILP
jgi:hypothetical protein